MKRHLINFLSGFLAGFFIGLGGYAFVLCKSNLGDPSTLLGALCFPIGLFFVCSFGVNLYTGKIGYAFNKEANKFNALDFVIMLLGNLLGAMAIGLIAALYASYGNEALMDAARNVAASRRIDQSLPSLIAAFLKSMVCGMLVYIAVYLFKKSNNYAEKFIVVWIPIFCFVYLGCNHCIADFFYISAGLSLGWQSLVFMLIPIVGNSVGAILFDRALYLINKKSE